MASAFSQIPTHYGPNPSSFTTRTPSPGSLVRKRRPSPKKPNSRRFYSISSLFTKSETSLTSSNTFEDTPSLAPSITITPPTPDESNPPVVAIYNRPRSQSLMEDPLANFLPSRTADLVSSRLESAISNIMAFPTEQRARLAVDLLRDVFTEPVDVPTHLVVREFHTSGECERLVRGIGELARVAGVDVDEEVVLEMNDEEGVVRFFVPIPGEDRRISRSDMRGSVFVALPVWTEETEARVGMEAVRMRSNTVPSVSRLPYPASLDFEILLDPRAPPLPPKIPEERKPLPHQAPRAHTYPILPKKPATYSYSSTPPVFPPNFTLSSVHQPSSSVSTETLPQSIPQKAEDRIIQLTKEVWGNDILPEMGLSQLETVAEDQERSGGTSAVTHTFPTSDDENEVEKEEEDLISFNTPQRRPSPPPAPQNSSPPGQTPPTPPVELTIELGAVRFVDQAIDDIQHAFSALADNVADDLQLPTAVSILEEQLERPIHVRIFHGQELFCSMDYHALVDTVDTVMEAVVDVKKGSIILVPEVQSEFSGGAVIVIHVSLEMNSLNPFSDVYAEDETELELLESVVEEAEVANDDGSRMSLGRRPRATSRHRSRETSAEPPNLRTPEKVLSTLKEAFKMFSDSSPHEWGLLDDAAGILEKELGQPIHLSQEVSGEFELMRLREYRKLYHGVLMLLKSVEIEDGAIDIIPRVQQEKQREVIFVVDVVGEGSDEDDDNDDGLYSLT